MVAIRSAKVPNSRPQVASRIVIGGEQCAANFQYARVGLHRHAERCVSVGAPQFGADHALWAILMPSRPRACDALVRRLTLLKSHDLGLGRGRTAPGPFSWLLGMAIDDRQLMVFIRALEA
jgi:hypothetical protein